MLKPRIGFIGQGYVGSAVAADFEQRGYDIVRYSLEPAFVANKELVAHCEIVFIAVPTPTVAARFDAGIVSEALSLVGQGKTAIIKSTILPGTTALLQTQYPNIFVMHSPEFLREKSAAEDAAHPERNIIGIPVDTPEFRQKAKAVMAVLPTAPYNAIVSAPTAECVKYIGNTFLYVKTVFMNLVHDFVRAAGGDWEAARQAVIQDSRIGASHTNIVADNGRGAGGHCFIKDYEAFLQFYKSLIDDPEGLAALEAYRDKNNQLLISTQKDLDLLGAVYGQALPKPAVEAES